MNQLFPDLFTETSLLMKQGGPVLWAMVIMSVILYGLIFSTWRALHHVQGEITALTPSETDDISVIEEEVAMFSLDQFSWVKRRLPMIAVLVAAAPLSGLLGTVFGMLITFNGIANQIGSQAIDNVSTGISSAMLTTQAGLFMAIPGAVLLAILKSRVTSVERNLEQKVYHHRVKMRGGTA